MRLLVLDPQNDGILAVWPENEEVQALRFDGTDRLRRLSQWLWTKLDLRVLEEELANSLAGGDKLVIVRDGRRTYYL